MIDPTGPCPEIPRDEYLLALAQTGTRESKPQRLRAVALVVAIDTAINSALDGDCNRVVVDDNAINRPSDQFASLYAADTVIHIGGPIVLGLLAAQRFDDNSLDIIGSDAGSRTRLTADLAFLANAFHGVPDPARLATAVKAALKPSGRFAIVNWHARPRERTTILGEPRGPKTELRLTPEKTIGAVKMDGLQFLTLVEIPPYHYSAIFERSPA